MDNRLMNAMGELFGVADVVGGDFPAGTIMSLNLGIISGSMTPPSATPSGTNGASVLQIGNVSTNEIYSKNTEHWSGSPGVYSLPTLPTSSSATDGCQILYINRNNQNIAFAYRDTRFLTNAQMVQPGETVIYATGSKAMAKFDNNGGVTLSTASAAGNTNYMQLTPAGFYIQTDFGSFSIDQNGINITAGSGAQLSLAGLAGAPISALSSYATISAAVVNVGGTAVNIGKGPVFLPAAMPLAPLPFGSPIPIFASTASNSVNISCV